VIADSKDELIKKLNRLKDGIESQLSQGMKVSMNKTKVMINGEYLKEYSTLANDANDASDAGVV